MSNALLQKAISCLAIQDVYLRGYNLTMNPEFDPKLNAAGLGVQLRANVQSGHIVTLRRSDAPPDEISSRLLRVSVETGLRFVAATPVASEAGVTTPGDAVKAELTAHFIAEYQITCPDLSEEARNVFAEKNAAFHVWPYWREFIESACVRARLPLVVLPMFAQSAASQNGQGETTKG